MVSKEQAYVHAISLAGIALSVAQACSSSYADHSVLCICPAGVKCLDNLTYAFDVAETFLTKRAVSQGLQHSQDLVHRNYAAARLVRGGSFPGSRDGGVGGVSLFCHLDHCLCIRSSQLASD